MAVQAAEYRQRPRVSVVIPTLNEANNLPHVLTRLPADVHEVIVVDGHSKDNTVEVVRQLRSDARIVMQTGQGKGNALACGFAVASGEVIVTIDADGSHDPAEIPRFVKALVEGADFVKGTRYAEGAGSTDITAVRSLGNHFLRHLVNLCYRTKYSDLCYGYMALWRRCVPALRLNVAPARNSRHRGDGFEVETLLGIRAAAAGLAVAEVPSFEHPRIHGISNLHPIQDGWRILVLLLVELQACRTAGRWRSGDAGTPAYAGARSGWAASGGDRAQVTAAPPSHVTPGPTGQRTRDPLPDAGPRVAASHARQLSPPPAAASATETSGSV